MGNYGREYNQLVFILDEIGSAILAEKERERKLYARYKELNPDDPDPRRAQISEGIQEGLDRAYAAFLAANKKFKA